MSFWKNLKKWMETPDREPTPKMYCGLYNGRGKLPDGTLWTAELWSKAWEGTNAAFSELPTWFFYGTARENQIFKEAGLELRRAPGTCCPDCPSCDCRACKWLGDHVAYLQGKCAALEERLALKLNNAQKRLQARSRPSSKAKVQK